MPMAQHPSINWTGHESAGCVCLQDQMFNQVSSKTPSKIRNQNLPPCAQKTCPLICIHLSSELHRSSSLLLLSITCFLLGSIPLGSLGEYVVILNF